MSPTVKATVEAIRSEIPDIVVSETDFGGTISVMNPATRQAVYASKAFRQERGEKPGYWEASHASIPAMVEWLREAVQGKPQEDDGK